MALIHQPALVDRRKPGGQIEIERQIDELERSSLERARVPKDVGTTVTGIQTAITLYTLVMASLMITGGKIGQMIGRKRAFAIGCVIYACGSLTTALSHSLAVLMFGWSFLEGR